MRTAYYQYWPASTGLVIHAKCHGNTASPDDDSTVQESTIIFSPLPRQEGIFRLTDYVEANEKDWDLGFHALIAGAFTEALAEMNWGKYC